MKPAVFPYLSGFPTRRPVKEAFGAMRPMRMQKPGEHFLMGSPGCVQSTTTTAECSSRESMLSDEDSTMLGPSSLPKPS
eukprot:CAMPEP_0185902896 /NCGR_PEP_ID=MMETSP0196C-20130402/2109_1 /TAXON_ID=2932 /ORGANISM="Alexandrium fundyense, Strain CCMP1719" /LENGTH=78 /DNA_ID=CAMNT_0028621827 /DNA_START=19 /DNA_END=251 /DNA_ORIENTATION=+